MIEQWLIMKRGLYYRPNNSGYTGIRDQAGRYTYEDALESITPDGVVRMILQEDAPEYTEACYPDLKLAHKIDKQYAAELRKPFISAFMDGRNEHGTHLLPLLPTNVDAPHMLLETLEVFEQIFSDAEKLGHQVGHCIVITLRGIQDEHFYFEYDEVSPFLTKAFFGDPQEQNAVIDGYMQADRDEQAAAMPVQETSGA